MKMLFKKMPYLKFVVVLVGYLLFTGQTTTETCDFLKSTTRDYPFDAAQYKIGEVSYSSPFNTTGYPFSIYNNFAALMAHNTQSPCDDYSYYYNPTSVYVLIKNGSTVLDSVRMSVYSAYYSGRTIIQGSINFNLPGTYTLQYIVNIQGMRLLGPENAVAVSGSIISPAKYKLSGFSYTSSGNDTTYNYAGTIDTNKNYLTFINGFRMNSMLKLPFSAAERNQYKWLTLDSLKMDYTAGTYAIERTNTIGNYNLRIEYQGNQAVFNGALTADSLVLSWKYAGNQNAPTFTLKYKK